MSKLTTVLPADTIDSTRSALKLKSHDRHRSIATYVGGSVVVFSYAGKDQTFKVNFFE